MVCLVIDATMPLGRGDRFVAAGVPRDAVVVVNKVDIAKPARGARHSCARPATLELSEYFPVSAQTGEGVDALVEHLVPRLPEGPLLYPDDVVTDVPEAFWVAELVREQLFRSPARSCRTRSRLGSPSGRPGPRIRCEILVERESQKGMVIGKGGSVLKEVGIAVREQLPAARSSSCS